MTPPPTPPHTRTRLETGFVGIVCTHTMEPPARELHILQSEPKTYNLHAALATSSPRRLVTRLETMFLNV